MPWRLEKLIVKDIFHTPTHKFLWNKSEIDSQKLNPKQYKERERVWKKPDKNFCFPQKPKVVHKNLESILYFIP